MLIVYLAKKLTFARERPVRENDRFFILAVAVECAPAHMARTSLTSVGSEVNSPAPLRRPSFATGRNADILEG
jgi:hypothetical protein